MSSSKTITLNLSNYFPHQWKFITSNKRQTGLIGGLSSGKTVAGLAVCLKMHMTKRAPDVYCNDRLIKKGKSNGWVIFPTFDKAALLFTLPFLQILRDANIKFRHANNMIITKYGTITILSMAYPLRFVGSNLTWAYLDEADIGSYKKTKIAYQKLMGRMRGCLNAQIFMTGTPLGYGLLYSIFNELHPDKLAIHARTRDNPAADLNYIRSLLLLFPLLLLHAYLLGQFCNLFQGRAYKVFNLIKHIIDQYVPRSNTIIVGIDFNVRHFSMCFALYIDEKIIVFDLAQFDNYNTVLACLYIKHKYPNKTIIIAPDATGKYRKTSAASTDFLILLQAGFKICYRTNPDQRDRINTVNNGFLKGKIIITKNCKILARDLMQVAITDDGRLDKSLLSTGINHMSDAFGYIVVNYLPLSQRPKAYVR